MGIPVADAPVTERLGAWLYALTLSALILGFVGGVMIARACGWGMAP